MDLDCRPLFRKVLISQNFWLDLIFPDYIKILGRSYEPFWWGNPVLSYICTANVLCPCFETKKVQSNLVIPNSKALSEILPDIRTSTYQICRIEEKLIRLTTFNKCMCKWILEVRDILKILWKRVFPQYHDGLASQYCKPCFLILSLCISYVTQLINSCSKETKTTYFITYTNCAKLYFLTNFDDWKMKVY